MGVIHKSAVTTDRFVSIFKVRSVPLHQVVHAYWLQGEEYDGDDHVEGQRHVRHVELAQEVVESAGDENTGYGAKGDGNPHVSNIVVFSVEEREEDGDDSARENPVEGTDTVGDESPRVKANKQFCGSGKASTKDAPGTNMWMGEEDSDEDEEAKQGVVHKGWLPDGSEKGVETVGECPGGGGEGPVGEVAGDDGAVAQEGGPGVGLGEIRHDVASAKEWRLGCQ